MRYIVGAYAIAPSASGWDRAREAEFMRELREVDSANSIGGLELGFYGELHRFDSDWFLGELRPEWEHVLTCIPGTMDRVARDPEFGLASDSERGRRAAIDFARAAHAAVVKLNGHFKRSVVRAVEIHSAPRRLSADAPSSSASLARSLDELRAWDWRGARLMIEHCDAWSAAHAPIKGFLPIEAEIAALQASRGPTPVGVVVNWARSVLETRDPRTPAAHLALARAAGLAVGLMFSGTTAGPDALYGEWQDRHMPFAPTRPGGIGQSGSLLTEAEARACLSQGELAFVGHKICVMPTDLPIAAKLEVLRETARILDRCAPLRS